MLEKKILRPLISYLDIIFVFVALELLSKVQQILTLPCQSKMDKDRNLDVRETQPVIRGPISIGPKGMFRRQSELYLALHYRPELDN